MDASGCGIWAAANCSSRRCLTGPGRPTDRRPEPPLLWPGSCGISVWRRPQIRFSHPSIGRSQSIGSVPSRKITSLAVEEGNQVRDYACTLLGAVVGQSGAAYLQIGDGAIVVTGEEVGDYGWIFWPQHGEYANTTNFLTEERAAETLEFEIGPAVNEVAVFTDGIERLVLDFSSNAVHSPFFRPIFKWLATTEPTDEQQPSEALITYLGSDHVNKRTDDDKTLVIATRANPE